MYGLNLGLPINSWMHWTGFRCHSSTISVLGAPPSSRMSPFTSRSSHVHSSPGRSALIFYKRDQLLWNEVHPAHRICDALVSHTLKNESFANLFQFQKVICGYVSCSQLNYPPCNLPIPFIWEPAPNWLLLGDLGITHRFKHCWFSV